MILSFKTQINGKPTYFVEKIWKSLQPVEISEYIAHIDGKYLAPMCKRTDMNAKLHTIRKDEKNRWKPGMEIDFFINARQRNMFRFAPRIPVVKTQSIVISNSSNGFQVSVEGKNLWNYQIEQLAINDGFDNLKDLKDYFIQELENGFFTGKIIHWTDFKY